MPWVSMVATILQSCTGLPLTWYRWTSRWSSTTTSSSSSTTEQDLKPLIERGEPVLDGEAPLPPRELTGAEQALRDRINGLLLQHGGNVARGGARARQAAHPGAANMLRLGIERPGEAMRRVAENCPGEEG